jgi:probable phosphoglycerate mutase
MIYLMRHGETIWNAEQRLQGRQDTPLTAKGVTQAQAFGQRLKEIVPNPDDCRLIASPLGRAWQTAVLAVTGMGRSPHDIELEPRLVEHAFGQWEGLNQADLKRNHAEAIAARLADKWNVPATDGESYALVADRVGAWLAEQDEDEIKIVFCHGVIARVMRGLYADMPKDDLMQLPEPQDRIFKLSGGAIEEILV